MTHTTTLRSPDDARAKLRRLLPWLVERIESGRQFVLTVREEKRNEDQSAKFHAICTDLAKLKHPWFGKPRSKDDWKTLLVSGHSVATAKPVEVVQGLEGELVALRESTAAMGKTRMALLIEYSLAWCAANGIEMEYDDGTQ